MAARYAADVERRVLVGAYATGAGGVGFTVAALPPAAAQDAALRVAACLDRLSSALWRCYTHPAEAGWGRPVSEHRELAARA